MVSKKQLAFSALAACALGLTALASVRHPVTRPLNITGEVTYGLNWITGDWEAWDWGEATHTGRFINHGSGSGYNLEGGLFTLTAANGDQIFAVLLNPTGTSVWFDKGTGRFLECSGGFNSSSSTLVSDTWDGSVEYLTYKYDGKGTITY
jgi:hypothetical protein